MLHAIGALLLNLLNLVSIEGAIGLGALIGVGYLMPVCMHLAIDSSFVAASLSW